MQSISLATTKHTHTQTNCRYSPGCKWTLARRTWSRDSSAQHMTRIDLLFGSPPSRDPNIGKNPPSCSRVYLAYTHELIRGALAKVHILQYTEVELTNAHTCKCQSNTYGGMLEQQITKHCVHKTVHKAQGGHILHSTIQQNSHTRYSWLLAAVAGCYTTYARFFEGDHISWH